MGEGECEWEKHWAEVLRQQERSHEGVAVGKFYHATCGHQELRQGDVPSLKTKETKGTCLLYEKRCLD